MKSIHIPAIVLFATVACSVVAQSNSKSAKKPETIKRGLWTDTPSDESHLALNLPIRHLSVHHTGVATFRGDGSAKGELNKILSDHAKVEGWGDIAYHYLIGPDGLIYEGRDPKFASNSRSRYLGEADWKSNRLHTAEEVKKNPKDFPLGGTAFVPKKVTGERPGKIGGHVTICFLGDFNNAEPSPKAKESFYSLAAYLLTEYKLTPKDVWCHREVASSTCPGDKAYLWLRSPAAGRYAFGKGLVELTKRMK